MSNHDLHTWPELAADLYDKLTGRNAEISYEFENMEVAVPRAVNDATNHAPWRLNGTLKIRARAVDAA